MPYIETIYLKRHEYFLNFANSFFTKEFWDQILQDHNPSCGFLSAFYTMVQARCDTSKEETSKIVFNSLKEKCLKNESYEGFIKVLDKNLKKMGAISIFPFFNRDLKKAFKSFELLYMQYEADMHKQNEI